MLPASFFLEGVGEQVSPRSMNTSPFEIHGLLQKNLDCETIIHLQCSQIKQWLRVAYSPNAKKCRSKTMSTTQRRKYLQSVALKMQTEVNLIQRRALETQPKMELGYSKI